MNGRGVECPRVSPGAGAAAPIPTSASIEIPRGHQNVITLLLRPAPLRPISFPETAGSRHYWQLLRTSRHSLDRPLKAEITGSKPVGGTNHSAASPQFKGHFRPSLEPADDRRARFTV